MGISVFYGYVTDYHTFRNLKPSPFIIPPSADQKSRWVYLGPLLRVSQGQNQGVSLLGSYGEALEECNSKFIQVVDKIQFLAGMAKVSVSLLTVSSLRSSIFFFTWSPPVPKPATVKQVLLMLSIPLTSLLLHFSDFPFWPQLEKAHCLYGLMRLQ